ncbi:MAG: cell filamentation protein Fic [Acidobacteria bacterium RBG_16_70_10]|nr:MAG: cell filamentation protein Fic [Acidobacteria bacterium RBG_16_70_10]
MQSLASDYLSHLVFDASQLATIQRLGEARGRQDLFVAQIPEQLELLRQTAVVESSESSNRIEGVVAAAGRVEAIVLKSATPRDRSEQEIAGYRDALQLIHESHEHMAFTTNVVLQLHSMLFRYLPSQGGVWKATDNEIVERDAQGRVTRIRFTPVPAVGTPGAMLTLANLYDAAVKEGRFDPLILIPLAVLDFLCIHPFRDGNGRMARLLTLLLLYRSRYRVGRYISLERVIEETKETYFEALQRSSQGWHEGQHNSRPWLDYSWGVMLRAYRQFEERVGRLSKGRGSKTELVREAIDRRVGPFSISDIEANCPGVSRDMVRVVLRRLRDEGAIIPQGKGRGARWIRKQD